MHKKNLNLKFHITQPDNLTIINASIPKAQFFPLLFFKIKHDIKQLNNIYGPWPSMKANCRLK